MQQIGIDRERRFAALVLRDRDLVLFGEVDELGAAILNVQSRHGAITLISGLSA